MKGVHLTDSTNLDNLIDTGIYYSYGGNTITGKPAGVSAFGLEIYKVAGSYVGQRLTDSGGSNRMFLRIYDTHSWSGWSEIALKSDLPKVKNISAAFNEINWIESHKGMWYAEISQPISNTITGIWIGDFFSMYATDMVTPYVTPSKAIGLMSNTNKSEGSIVVWYSCI